MCASQGAEWGQWDTENRGPRLLDVTAPLLTARLRSGSRSSACGSKTMVDAELGRWAAWVECERATSREMRSFEALVQNGFVPAQLRSPWSRRALVRRVKPPEVAAAEEAATLVRAGIREHLPAREPKGTARAIGLPI